MADPKRLQIINAIMTRLRTISQTGGYHNTLTSKQVSKVFKAPVSKAPADYPHLIVVPGDARYKAVTNCKVSSDVSGRGNNGWAVGIWVHEHAPTSDEANNTLMEKLEKITADIIKVMAVDRQINSLSFVQKAHLRAVFPNLTTGQNIGSYQIIYEVVYEFAEDAA